LKIFDENWMIFDENWMIFDENFAKTLLNFEGKIENFAEFTPTKHWKTERSTPLNANISPREACKFNDFHWYRPMFTHSANDHKMQ
jgi:hypothetical protein